jgi:membrane associated rhomboid family serine protease
MTPVPVGFQCPECIGAAAQTAATRAPRSLSGARLHQDPRLITKILVAVNVIIYGLQYLSNDNVTRQYMQLGVAIANGEPWRLVTGAFLHASITHLFFNMVALWFVGSAVEPRLGRWRYIVVYLLSALGGAVLSYVVDSPMVPTVGASGAVFGLFGSVLILAMRLRLDIAGILGIIVLNAVLGFVIPGINWRAHLGGLIVGSILTAAMVYPPQRYRTLVTWIAIIGVGVVCALAASARTASLLSGVG